MDGKQSEGLVVGRNPVREALERRPSEIEKVLLQKGTGGQALAAIGRLARGHDVQVQYVPPVRLDQMVQGLNHQGVVAIASPVRYLQVDEMLAQIAPNLDLIKQQKPTLLLLDQIQDSFNFGAIMRSAVAAGVAGVVVPTQGMAPLNAAALKASAGTASRIPIARTDDLAGVLYQLKERGFWIAGASGKGGESVWEMDWERPMAIVIGNEGRGMRERVATLCDHLVSIPMPGAVESLNASVAAGILVFAATRHRLVRADAAEE